jgi:hypothetical protein
MPHQPDLIYDRDKDRIATMGSAFDATLKDPELPSLLQQRHLPFQPSHGKCSRIL